MSPSEYATYNIAIVSVEKKLKLRPKRRHELGGEKQIYY